MCLVAYSDGQESLSFQFMYTFWLFMTYTFSMETPLLVGNSFTNAHKDWKEGMYKNFKEWSVKQFSHQPLESGDKAELPIEFQKAKDISLEKNHCRHFLPPLQIYRTIKQKQRVIHAYVELFIISQYWARPSFALTLRTGEFIGSKTAGFPFVLAAKEDQTIYSPECIHEGFSLSDPDHLLGSGIISLYWHWLEHQKKKGLVPFIVLNPSPLHGPIV